jgi:hypothetical protein
MILLQFAGTRDSNFIAKKLQPIPTDMRYSFCVCVWHCYERSCYSTATSSVSFLLVEVGKVAGELTDVRTEKFDLEKSRELISEIVDKV